MAALARQGSSNWSSLSKPCDSQIERPVANMANGLKAPSISSLFAVIRSIFLEELVDTIDVWKRAYARICIARDEMEACSRSGVI